MVEGNPVKKLAMYLEKNITKGYTEDSLRFALMNQGYSRSLIERAFDLLHLELAKKAPVIKEKPIIKHQIIDENNQPIEIKKPWWKQIFD
jgi:hypothetical protein